MLYAYFLYIHFFLNLIVGIYFLVIVRQSNRQELVDYCSDVFENTSVGSSCSRLMSVSTYVFIAIVAALLLLELCGSRLFCVFAFSDLEEDGTVIAARYVHRLRMQKRQDRSRRLGYFHALATPETQNRHVRQASDDIELLHSRESTSDSRDPEDVVLDIGPPKYMPVLTHDRDLPLDIGHDTSSSPSYPLSDSHIRALPPRPRPTAAGSPPIVAETSSRPQESTAELGRLPNPYEHTSHSRKARQGGSLECEEEERSLHTVEVSTNAHAALMDHATYIESRFTGDPPAPTFFTRSLP